MERGMKIALGTAVILLWSSVGFALSTEQAQAVILKLAYQANINRRLVDKVHSNKNWAKDPEFSGYVKLIPPAQLELNLERSALSHDLALCKATENFGLPEEIATTRQHCADVRSEIQGIEPWNRDKVIDDADKMEREVLKLYE